jgi:uncharacterized membrane protein
MQMTPLIATHMTAALLAVATGPVALWARHGKTQQPKLHRAFGYVWVVLMLVTATSAVFIRDYRLPNIAGYTAIHLLVPVVFISLFGSFRCLAAGQIKRHQRIMQGLYVGACLVAGGFTLLPGRYLGDLLRSSVLHQILTHTPVWVWGLLAALLALGFSQTRQRTVGVMRTAWVPIGLGGFSLYSTACALGSSAGILGIWWVACALTAALVLRSSTPPGTHYDPRRRQFVLPGSWVPMVLIVGIFLTKYAVGASLSLAPTLKNELGFCLAVAALSGVFSGIFAGRTLRLLRLIMRAPSQNLTVSTRKGNHHDLPSPV